MLNILKSYDPIIDGALNSINTKNAYCLIFMFYN